jgi:hypothetical protein
VTLKSVTKKIQTDPLGLLLENHLLLRLMNSTGNTTTQNPDALASGSASAPTAASSNAAAQAGEGAAPILSIKKEEPALHPITDTISAHSDNSEQSTRSELPPDLPAFTLDQHHEIYFRLKVTSSPDKSPHRFANSSRLCVALLAQLAIIPALAGTGLFKTGKLTLTISKHHNPAAKAFIYTASFATASCPNDTTDLAATITDLILLAQINSETDHKAPLPKGFLFNLPIIVPGSGHRETSTRCSFSYDRTSLLGLTTIDFQVKVPPSISISPQEDFALLIVQLFTPRANLSDSEYMALTRPDRVRFAKCCTPRKSVTTPHGDWMDELMFGTFALNFEDADSRDSYIWNFLMFGAVFGLDPRFGHHQQYQLFIPTLQDQFQLDRRPAAMRDAVKMFKANQLLANLMPAKPRRSRPKTSDATSSGTESESLFLENIARRSEAILILPEVPPEDALTALHYPPLDSAQFTHLLHIPQAPAGGPQVTAIAKASSECPADQTTSLTRFPLPKAKLTCMSWDRQGRCQSGPNCPFTHNAVAASPACMSWDKHGSCKQGDSCMFIHNAAATSSDDFIGEGRRDTACIKFGENRCRRGDRCDYKHDIRDVLTKQLQRLNIPTATAAQATTFAGRSQAASPGRGTVQLASFLNALDRTIASNLLAPLQPPLLTALVSLASCASNAPAPLLAIQPVQPQLTDPKRLPLEQHPTLKLEALPIDFTAPQLSALVALAACASNDTAPLLAVQPAQHLLANPKRPSMEHHPTLKRGSPPIAPNASRFMRSAPAVNIGDLNGFCTRGHKISKRTPIKSPETHKCSFCKTYRQHWRSEWLLHSGTQNFKTNTNQIPRNSQVFVLQNRASLRGLHVRSRMLAQLLALLKPPSHSPSTASLHGSFMFRIMHH